MIPSHIKFYLSFSICLFEPWICILHFTENEKGRLDSYITQWAFVSSQESMSRYADIILLRAMPCEQKLSCHGSRYKTVVNYIYYAGNDIDS